MLWNNNERPSATEAAKGNNNTPAWTERCAALREEDGGRFIFNSAPLHFAQRGEAKGLELETRAVPVEKGDERAT